MGVSYHTEGGDIDRQVYIVKRTGLCPIKSVSRSKAILHAGSIAEVGIRSERPATARGGGGGGDDDDDDDDDVDAYRRMLVRDRVQGLLPVSFINVYDNV